MLRNNQSNTIIGFFAATGAHYANMTQPKACIQLPDDSFNGSYSYDKSFADLTDMLDFEPDAAQANGSHQHVFGYNGCASRGGLIFAYGIDEPVEHLYQQVLAQVKTLPQGKKLKLVLVGHSRGTLSAILLAKKIKTHPQLKKQVKVILDLRDPVPGNSHHFAKADFAHTTIAKQLYDLTDCPIDEVHITVQERTAISFCFHVLVPAFHPKTKFQIEMLPGAHEIQGRRCYTPLIDSENFINNAILDEHPTIYLIGLLKSLQIMHEHGTPIYHNACISYLNKFLRGVPLNDYYKPGSVLLPEETITSLFNSLDENGFSYFLKKLQLHLYDALLLEFKAPNTLPKHKTNLHFGGHFGIAAPDPKQANCFNMRHAALIQEMKNDLLDPPALDYYPKPLLGFKARAGEKPWKKRIDLNNARFIKIPNNLFQQKYQRIMLVLDQQIKTDLIIPNSKPKLRYSDAVKRKLFAIANEKITDRQKLLAMETFLIEIYWDVRANEGLFDSRLRRGLEWILNSPLFLNIKGRYGLSFPEKPENTTRYRENLFNLSHRLSNGHRKYATTAENHPAFYQHSIKFLIGLEHIKFKTKRKKEMAQLIEMVNNLLVDGKTLDKEAKLFETFQIKLLTVYNAVRQHEKSKTLYMFRVSTLGNFIEKFLRDELKIKDIPHEYNAAKINNIITRLTQCQTTLPQSPPIFAEEELDKPPVDLKEGQKKHLSLLEEDPDDTRYYLVPDQEENDLSDDEPSNDEQVLETPEKDRISTRCP